VDIEDDYLVGVDDSIEMLGEIINSYNVKYVFKSYSKELFLKLKEITKISRNS